MRKRFDSDSTHRQKMNQAGSNVFWIAGFLGRSDLLNDAKEQSCSAAEMPPRGLEIWTNGTHFLGSFDYVHRIE